MAEVDHAVVEPGRLQLGPARLLGISAWVLCLTVGGFGLAGVPLLAWTGAGLVAGISLSGSV